MHSRRRAATVVAVIIILVIIDLVIVGLVLSGTRNHDLAIRRVETVKAFYAAEAGMNMAIRELMLDEEQDGDCTVGSISHDGDSGNDPELGKAQWVVTASTVDDVATVRSHGRAGDARRQLWAMVNISVGGGGGTVAREETVTAAQEGGSPLTMPMIGGGTDQTYVLFVATRSNEDVTNVTGGGLTWSEQIEQCGGRDQQGIRLWTAEGSPGSSFQASITWDSGGRPIVATLSRYSGVGALKGVTGENTNGVLGGCSGGSDDDPTQITLTSTTNGSVHVIGVNSRNDPIESYTAGYAEFATDQDGSGGELTILTTYDKTFDPAGSEQFQGTTNDTNDWCTAGIVLRP